MADEKNHPLVDLMLERMKSHPEEFEGEGNRWNDALVAIHQWAAPEQRGQVDRALDDIMLDKAYNEAMDELLNGEQRRAEAKAEEEAAIAAKNAALQHQMQIAKQQMAQRMQQDHDNAVLAGLGQYAHPASPQGISTLGGKSTTWTAMDDPLTTTSSGSPTSWPTYLKKALGL